MSKESEFEADTKYKLRELRNLIENLSHRLYTIEQDLNLMRGKKHTEEHEGMFQGVIAYSQFLMDEYPDEKNKWSIQNIVNAMLSAGYIENGDGGHCRRATDLGVSSMLVKNNSSGNNVVYNTERKWEIAAVIRKYCDFKTEFESKIADAMRSGSNE